MGGGGRGEEGGEGTSTTRGAGATTSVMVTVTIPVPVVAIGWPVAAALPPLPPTALILLTLYTRNTEHCFLEPAEWDVLYVSSFRFDL
jgi:hypothetical protein